MSRSLWVSLFHGWGFYLWTPMVFKDSWGGIRPGPGQNYTYLSICPAGVWWTACTGLMEYSLFCHHFYALSVSPVKKKLGLLFIMMLLWIYMLYSCVGYCATMPPSLVVDNSNNRARETGFLGKYAEAESGRPGSDDVQAPVQTTELVDGRRVRLWRARGQESSQRLF